MADAQYKPGFLRGMSQYFSGRRSLTAASSTVAPEHGVAVVKRIGQAGGAYVIYTVGLGRAPRLDPELGDEHRHVELIAESREVGPQIGEVLTKIGELLHGAPGGTWKTYDTVSLRKPLHGLQHFDLRPGGEVDVAPDLRVVLYKVVPLAPDELERTRDEGGSQWVDAGSADPDAAARDLSRWTPALRSD